MAICLRDPEQLGDDRDGHELKQIGDEVELPERQGILDGTIDDRVDPGPEGLDRPRREALLTSRRSRVWSGGSMSIIWTARRSQKGA
jgi:hypothetical protein